MKGHCINCHTRLEEPVRYMVCEACIRISHEKLAKYHDRADLMNRYESMFKKQSPVYHKSSVLEMSNSELVSRLKRVRNKQAENRTAKEDDLVSEFGEWRGSVFYSESQNESNILYLLMIASHYYSAGEHDKYQELVSFACNEYGFSIGGLDGPPPEKEDIIRIAEKHSKNHVLLPRELRFEGGYIPRKEEKKEAVQVSFSEVFDAFSQREEEIDSDGGETSGAHQEEDTGEAE